MYLFHLFHSNYVCQHLEGMTIPLKQSLYIGWKANYPGELRESPALPKALARRYIPHTLAQGRRLWIAARCSRASSSQNALSYPKTPTPGALGNFVCDTRALFGFVIFWISIRGQIVIFCEISDQWIPPGKNGFGGIMWKPVKKKEKISREEKSPLFCQLLKVKAGNGGSQQQVERS